MLTFKNYIDELRQNGKNKMIWGQNEITPYMIFSAYMQWLKDKVQAKAVTIEEDKLVIQLLVQIRIINDCHERIKSSHRELPALRIDDNAIRAYQETLKPLVENWIKAIDARLYEHVRRELETRDNIPPRLGAVLACVGLLTFAIHSSSTWFTGSARIIAMAAIIPITSLLCLSILYCFFSHSKPRLHIDAQYPYQPQDYITRQFKFKRASIDRFLTNGNNNMHADFDEEAFDEAFNMHAAMGTEMSYIEAPSTDMEALLIPSATSRDYQHAAMESFDAFTHTLLTFRYKTPYTHEESYRTGMPEQRLQPDNGPVRFAI